MKLFGKHIFRSIKAHPIQPIIITLIVALCVAVMIVSVILPINIYRNEQEGLGVDEWSSDLYIALKSTSDVRLVYEDDVADAVGERGRVLGEFSLTGFSDFGKDEDERSQVDIGAFDLQAADEFYQIRYLERGKITNNNLNTTAIISTDFAEYNSLKLGDTFAVNVLGHEFSYTVRAIAAETGIFKSCKVLVDVISVRQALAERSPIIAALPSDISPYTGVHIKVADGYDAEELKSELESLPAFENKRVEIVGDTSSVDSFVILLTVSVLIPALLLLVVAAMMITSTLDLLTKKRQVDLALFRAVGADSRQMNLMLYLEALIYGTLGGIIGSILSIPIIRGLDNLYDFRHVDMSFGAFELVIGIASSLIFTTACAYMRIRKQRRKSLSSELVGANLDTDRRFSLKKLLYAAPLALCGVITLLLPARHKYAPAFLTMIFTVVFLYVIAPYIIYAFSSLASRIMYKMRRGGGKLMLATHSCMNSYPLKHAGRIMVIMLTMLISLSSVLIAIEQYLAAYTSIGTFDYAGVSVDDVTKEDLYQLDGVVALADTIVERNVLLDDSIVIAGIAVNGDAEQCFNGDIFPRAMPVGDNIALSVGIAKMLGVDVGDIVKCEIGGIPCELTLSEIVKTSGNFVFYDANYIGADSYMTCICLDGTDESREELMALLDERGVRYITVDEFFSSTYNAVNRQLVVFKQMFYAMILMTAVGISNVLSEQRIARRREFEVLVQNGMTRRGVTALSALEAACLLVFAAFASLVFSQLICVTIDTAATSFGLKLYF